MTGGERPFGLGTPEAAEDEDLTEIDERKRGRTRHHVLHQQREALCVIDHADTRLARDRLRQDVLYRAVCRCEEQGRADYTDMRRLLSR